MGRTSSIQLSPMKPGAREAQSRIVSGSRGSIIRGHSSVLPPDTSGTRFPGAASLTKQTFLCGLNPYLPPTDSHVRLRLFLPTRTNLFGKEALEPNPWGWFGWPQD